MHRNVENNLRWSFLLGLFHVISMTSRVTNLELGAIRRFRLQRCDPCSISCCSISLTFWKATEVRMVQYHSHLFVLLGMIFFPSNSNPPKKSRATVCYGDCIAAFYRNFNHHPRIRLPPGGLKIPAWLPAGDSPGGRKLFGTAPGSPAEKGGRDLAGRLGWTSPGWSTRFVDLLVV